MKTQTPKYFNNKLGIGILFLPLGIIYAIITNIKKHLIKPYKSKAKVICIGNITLGGVGKTPLVIKIIETLQKKHIKVGVLSRGYGGKLSSNKPVLVDGKKHSAKDVGDEVFMIYEKFKGKIPVCICSNRGNGAKILEKIVDVIVMDDGLQNYTIKKDKSVIVFDGEKTIGNGFIFPAGPLRETISSGIKNVDAVVIMRKINQVFEKKLSKFKKHIFRAKTKPVNLLKLKNKTVIAFAGIGNPQKFYDTLKEAKIKIKQAFDFPDHYKYKISDLRKIIEASKNMPILTTQKDFVKIPAEYQNKIQCVEIDLEIDNEQKFFDILLK